MEYGVGDWLVLAAEIETQGAAYVPVIVRSIVKAFASVENTKAGKSRLYLVGLALGHAGAWKMRGWDYMRLGRALMGQPDGLLDCFLVALPNTDERKAAVLIGANPLHSSDKGRANSKTAWLAGQIWDDVEESN